MKKKLLSVLLTLVMLVPGFGSFSVVASAENYVAQVIDSNGNATDYSTFEEAWKYAVNYGKTFKLLSDWMVSGGDFGANESNKAIFFSFTPNLVSMFLFDVGGQRLSFSNKNHCKVWGV